jgi:hypothetical protein
LRGGSSGINCFTQIIHPWEIRQISVPTVHLGTNASVGLLLGSSYNSIYGLCMLSLRLAISASIVIITVSLIGCSAPSTPASSDQVTITGPIQGYAGNHSNFTAKVNFSSTAVLLYEWEFDSSISQTKTANQSWAFQQAGKHIIGVRVIRSGDNALLCAAVDTISILATVVEIIPDSLVASLSLSTEFKLQTIQGVLPPNAEVKWQIDSSHFKLPLSDNMADVSYSFDSVGIHRVSAIVIDSTNSVIASASTIITVGPFAPSFYTGFHHLEIQFSGQHTFAYEQHQLNDNCSLPFQALNGSTFSGSFPIYIYDSTIEGFGNFSKDGLTLDTLHVTLRDQGAQGGGHCSCNDTTYILILEDCYSYTQLSLASLPMLYARPDSIAFGLTGTDCENHVRVQAVSATTYTNGGCAACNFPSDSSFYTGTTWSTASIRVTLYR